MQTSVTTRASDLRSKNRIVLEPFLKPGAALTWEDNLAVAAFDYDSPGLRANRDYFDNPDWAANYLKYCHRNRNFRSRWLAATRSWQGKVVVDVGCGPGNVAACLKESAKVLVGVDVSRGALKMAERFGYLPVLADAHNLPLKSNCADIVILNATLHHCDNMAGVLAEAARLVAPGGMLVTDHDPQRSAWNFRGVGLALWYARLWIYRIAKKGFHRSADEQAVALTSEIHHVPGDGVTADLFQSVLKPLGFETDLYPHNHDLGSEVLDGRWGRAATKFRIAQGLSGMNTGHRDAALSLMCRATRRGPTL